MTRANRFFLPGYIWHITDRCINKNYFLKFLHDRRRWAFWLREASLRYEISILNYVVTSNHIHLLAMNRGDENSIARAMHLVSSRVAQEYNLRKNRKGPFWGDRYHATAVEAGSHFFKCMVYIDMNMVRAGVVRHPKNWPFCGYQEISGMKKRYTIIDKKNLINLFGVGMDELAHIYELWIDEYLESNEWKREEKWTESLAVGGKNFIEEYKKMIRGKMRSRKIRNDREVFYLKEAKKSYC